MKNAITICILLLFLTNWSLNGYAEDLGPYRQLISCVFAENLSSINRLENSGYTVNGNPIIINSPYGKAMDFDGTDNYVEKVSFNDELNLTTSDFTVVTLLKSDGYVNQGSSINVILAKGQVSVTANGFMAISIDSNDKALFMIDDSDISAVTDNGIADGSWHLVAGVRNGNTTYIYVDGVLQTDTGNVTGLTVNTTSTFKIGRDNTATRYFNGQIAYTLMFNRALTATEIDNIYKGKAFEHGQSLISQWDMSNINPPDTGWKNFGYHGVGTNLGSTNVVNGRNGGKALTFNGTTQGVVCPTITQFNLATSATISFWGKKSATNKDVFVGSGTATNNGIWLQWYIDSTVNFSVRAGDINACTVTLPFDSQWHHFVGVYDGTQAVNADKTKIYIDGVLQSVTVTGANPSVLALDAGTNFGMDIIFGTVFGGSEIEAVRIYDKPLTQLEIEDIYAREK